jgi:hypothetical protein
MGWTMKSLMRYAGLALAGLLACEAGADTTLCIHKKTGRVRAVQTGACKGREEAVKLADPAAQPTGAIQVYDANNQFLGLLTGNAYPYATQVYLPSERISFRIRPVGDGTVGDLEDVADWSDRQRYYTSSDCSGPAYIGNYYAGKIINTGQGFIRYDAPMQQIDVRGVVPISKGQPGSCAPAPSVNKAYVVEDSPTPVTLPFSVPVALPLQFRN